MPAFNLSPDDLQALPRVHRATIPEDYRDEMGHMNVMWYLHLFDRGAWGTFALFGADADSILAQHIGVFALQQHLTYHAEVHIGDDVTLYARVIGRSAKRMHFMQFIINETQGTLAATFEALAICIDMTTRRSTPWPEAIAAPLEALIGTHGALGWSPPLSGAIQV